MSKDINNRYTNGPQPRCKLQAVSDIWHLFTLAKFLPDIVDRRHCINMMQSHLGKGARQPLVRCHYFMQGRFTSTHCPLEAPVWPHQQQQTDGGTATCADEVGQRWRFSCSVWQQTLDKNSRHPQQWPCHCGVSAHARTQTHTCVLVSGNNYNVRSPGPDLNLTFCMLF